MAQLSATITNPADANNPFQVVNVSNVIKLTPQNYITWKIQLQAILTGYDLLKYVDGTFPAPSKQVTTDGVSTPNTAYTAWMRQDKLLFGALIGTLTPNVAPLVTRATTSQEAWTILAATYATPSKGRVNQLKDKLRSTVQGTQSVSDYLQSLVATADLLAELGKPVDADDLVSYILHGLNDGYSSIVDAIKARDSTIKLAELHDKLLVRELELAKTTSSPAAPATALTAQTKPRNARIRTSTNNPTTGRPYLPRGQTNNPRPNIS